jgi:hypothetical protein
MVITSGRNAAIHLPSFMLVFILIGVGACLAQEGAPFPQPPSTDKIANLLSSGDPRLVAWGVHYALVAKDPRVIPNLIDVADRWEATLDSNIGEADSAQTDQHDAMSAVLDAIIQLHGTVTTASLRNLAGNFPNQTAILLSRKPPDEAQSLSQEFYQGDAKTRGAHNLQYVSAVMLAQHPPPGFAADLFSSIHNRATITITKPGYSEAGTYGGGMGGSCFVDDSHQDWPLFGIYQLSTDKIEGSIVLIAGPDPVYVGRSETRHGIADFCQNFTFLVLGPEERRRFVARWLGMAPDDLDWETEATQTIVYRSDEQFYRELRKFIAHEQDKYRATGAALVAKNLMTVSEQEDSLPYLDLQFKDQRGSDARPIPAPASLPPHVSWPKQP